MQMYYVTGSERKKGVLEQFHLNPSAFNYQVCIVHELQSFLTVVSL